MSGRAEYGNKLKHQINGKLKTMPDIIVSYANTVFASREPTTGLTYIRAICSFVNYCTNNNPSLFSIEDHVTIDQIAAYLYDYRYRKQNNTIIEMKIASVKKQWSALNNFCDYLRKRKMIEENPMDFIDRPSGSEDTATKPHITKEDLQNLLNVIKQGSRNINRYQKITPPWISRDYTAILLLITTGMRREALIEIDVGDFNVENKTLKVVDKRHKSLTYTLPPSVIHSINEWLNYRTIILYNLNKPTEYINNGPMFIGMTGNRWLAKDLAEILKIYFKKVSDKPMSPHKLRAAFCTLYYEATGDIYAVQKAVGHSSPKVTQRYIVEKESHQKNAADYMANIIM